MVDASHDMFAPEVCIGRELEKKIILKLLYPGRTTPEWHIIACINPAGTGHNFADLAWTCPQNLTQCRPLVCTYSPCTSIIYLNHVYFICRHYPSHRPRNDRRCSRMMVACGSYRTAYLYTGINFILAAAFIISG